MRWGNWELDLTNMCLFNAHAGYGIDLEGVHSSAAILDWVFQIRNKSWADAGTMHDLLRAIDDVLCPQANYCPWEEDRRADGVALARAYAARAAG